MLKKTFCWEQISSNDELSSWKIMTENKTFGDQKSAKDFTQDKIKLFSHVTPKSAGYCLWS